jgi:hypothetical protein
VLAKNHTSLVTVRTKLATARLAQAAEPDELSPTFGTLRMKIHLLERLEEVLLQREAEVTNPPPCELSCARRSTCWKGWRRCCCSARRR